MQKYSRNFGPEILCSKGSLGDWFDCERPNMTVFKPCCLLNTGNLFSFYFGSSCAVPAVIIRAPANLINSTRQLVYFIKYCALITCRWRATAVSLNKRIPFKWQTTIHKWKTIVPLPRKPHFAFNFGPGKISCPMLFSKGQISWVHLMRENKIKSNFYNLIWLCGNENTIKTTLTCLLNY